MDGGTLVFDLDGTLIDSLPDLRAALNRLMAQRGLCSFAANEVAALVGDGSRRLVERAFAARGAAADEAAIASFTADYGGHATAETRAFPDVRETLSRLQNQGWRLAVCTNKPAEVAQKILAALAFDRFFAAVGGGDSFATQKPDPAHLTATIAAAGGDRTRAVMVGDHINDVAAAQGAGVPCIFAAWGYGASGMARDAAAVAERFRDITEIASRLVA